MLNSEQVKQFYNRTFFAGRNPREVECRLVIGHGEEEITIPAIKIRPENTIEDIFRSLYEFLQGGGAVTEEPAPSSQQGAVINEDGKRLADVEQVEYRGHLYLVERYGRDEFVIRNKEKGNVISERSPVGKGVVRRLGDR